MQMWLLSFALCITQLFVSPCTGHSTWPHIQVSDLLVAGRLNFWYYYFPSWILALWNVVPSRTFSPCSWLDPPNLSRCLRLFLVIYNCSLPVLMCSRTNILLDPSPRLSWGETPYFYLDLFSSHFQPPTLPVCSDLSANFLCLPYL